MEGREYLKHVGIFGRVLLEMVFIRVGFKWLRISHINSTTKIRCHNMENIS